MPPRGISKTASRGSNMRRARRDANNAASDDNNERHDSISPSGVASFINNNPPQGLQYAGESVDVYLERDFVATMSSEALLRFSATARSMAWDPVNAMAHRRCTLIVDPRVQTPSTRAILDVVEWMQSTRPNQPNELLHNFATSPITRLDTANLLDLYQAIRLFAIEPYFVWERLYNELVQHVGTEPPTLNLYQDLLRQLPARDQLMQLLVSNIYDGYLTHCYSMEQWLEIKAYFLDTEDEDLRTLVSTIFSAQRQVMPDRDCLDCVADFWRGTSSGDSSVTSIAQVEHYNDLYCARHWQARLASNSAPQTLTYTAPLDGAVGLEPTWSMLEQSAPVTHASPFSPDRSHRRRRRAQQHRGREAELAKSVEMVTS